MLPLLLSLGFWQLDRAEQKQAILDEYLHRGSLEPLDWSRDLATPQSDDAVLWRRAKVRGHYADSEVFLLDNQVMQGVAGYFVYSPLKIEGSDIRVIISRGWVPAGDFRDKLPEVDRPVDMVTLTGLITDYPLPPGVLLGDQRNNQQKLGQGIYRMQIINNSLLQQMLAYPLWPYIIRLDASAASGFMRKWPQPGSGKEMHLGYAFQWFSLSATLVVIYISVNLRRRKPD